MHYVASQACHNTSHACLDRGDDVSFLLPWQRNKFWDGEDADPAPLVFQGKKSVVFYSRRGRYQHAHTCTIHVARTPQVALSTNQQRINNDSKTFKRGGRGISFPVVAPGIQEPVSLNTNANTKKPNQWWRGIGSRFPVLVDRQVGCRVFREGGRSTRPIDELSFRFVQFNSNCSLSQLHTTLSISFQ